MVKNQIASEFQQSDPHEHGIDMILRIFKVARLLEHAETEKEKALITDVPSENHKSHDSRYCDREGDLN